MSRLCRIDFPSLQRLRLATPRLECRTTSFGRRLKWSNTRFQSSSSRPPNPSEIFAHFPWQHTPAFTPIVVQDPQSQTPEAWVEALESHFQLPSTNANAHGNQTELNSSTNEPDHYDISRFRGMKVADLVMRARWFYGHNLILHLGMKKQWNMISCIVRAISDRNYYMEDMPIMAYEPFAAHGDHNTLASRRVSHDDLSDSPIDLRLDDSNSSNQQRNFHLPLKEYGRIQPTSAMDSSSAYHNDPRDHQIRTQRGALGEVFSSLGQLILHAYHLNDVKESQDMMAHVLDTLAILHQYGAIPEYTYQCMSSLTHSDHAPPPYLEILFIPMLSAMLDAQWNLFQQSADLATFSSDAQFDIAGFEFPEHNNPKQILPFAHEIWLELILWVCIRGGWVYNGLELLEKVAGLHDSHKWKALSWRRSFSDSPDGNTVIESRALSSELVLAYAEALVDAAETAVGARGIPLRRVFDLLKILKTFLDESAQKTTSFRWGGILFRLIDSSDSKLGSNLNLSKDMMDLILPEFPQESSNYRLNSHNSPSLEPSSPQTADIIGGFLATYIHHGQIYLIKDLFIHLKEVGLTLSLGKTHKEQQEGVSLENDKTRSVTIAPEILARLIHFLTDIKDQEPEQDAFFNEIVAPLLSLELRAHPAIGSALVRYAVAVSDAQLLRETLKDAVSQSGKDINKQSLMLALLVAQVERRRWEAVQATVNLGLRDSSWQIRIVVTLVREVMRMQRERIASGDEENDLAVALDILRRCITRNIDFNWANAAAYTTRATMYTIVAILSTVDPGWGRFALKTIDRREAIQIKAKPYQIRKTTLHPNFFATILQGVADFGGAEAVRRVWTTWCEQLKPKNDYMSRMMPRIRPSMTELSYSTQPVEVSLIPSSKLAFLPRFVPNLTMIRVLLRSEYSEESQNQDLREEAERMLRAIGLEEWQVRQELDQARTKGKWATFDSATAGLDAEESQVEIEPRPKPGSEAK